MKVPFFLVMVIVSEAFVSSTGLPVIRHADLQQIARMILPYVTSRNRASKTEFPGHAVSKKGDAKLNFFIRFSAF